MAISLFKRKIKNDPKKGSSGAVYHSLTIKKIIKETDDAISIVFSNPGNEIKYLPGQYLTLILNLDGEEVRRSYSLSSSPHHDEELSVTVKKIDNGKVSKYLVEQLKPGDEIKIMEPKGGFTTEFNEANERDFVLFAGGSGITPLMSIMKSALLKEPKSKIHLIYQNRNENSIIYKDLLEEFKLKYPDRISFSHVLSQPSADWDGMKGRVSKEQIIDLFNQSQISTDKVSVFTCGPHGMMETVESTLDLLKVDKINRHKESFYSSEPISSKAVEPAATENESSKSTVTIIVDNEEHEVIVRNNEFILETALDADVNMPFSCQSGICTSCRGKLLSGQVKMEDPEGLSEEELEDGYILTCVSHPVSKDIKIEMG